MKIIDGGRELNEEETVQFLIKEMGWGESRARQRVSIGLGKSRGDVLKLEVTKPLQPDPSQSRRPVNMPRPAKD